MNKKITDILSVINLYLEDLKNKDGGTIFSHRNSLRLLLYPNNGYLIDDIKDMIPATELGKIEQQIRSTIHNAQFSEENRTKDKAPLMTLKEIIEQHSVAEEKSVYTLFYSWQSDLENKITRGFIKNVLEKSIKKIKEKYDIEILLDEDTRGKAGSPDIANTILAKIRRSDIFVADLSPVIENNRNVIPNPNVLFELGYAFSQLGDEKVIMIFNESFGDSKKLPFDLGLKRQTLFNCRVNDDIPKKRNELVNLMVSKIYSSITI